MRPVRLSVFARECGGQLHGEDRAVAGFATDHREVRPGDLFLAIRGANVDGHDFAARALAAGAAGVLAERRIDGPHVLVDNLVQALASFAQGRRTAFDGPVVGVTGSNGKTTTKEFIAAALRPLGTILKNPGNRNTEYTAPLIWAELDGHSAVVSELAMRGFGQIEHLCGFTQPTIGVVTMIGAAHIEMVGSREGIAKAKAEMLRAMAPVAPAVLWEEDDFLTYLQGQARGPVRTFGFSPEAELRILGYRALDWRRCVVRFGLDGAVSEAELPTLGRHQARNAAAALLVAHSLGVGLDEATACLPQAELPPMRMEATDLHGATVLLDAYNASPDSTVAAIQALAEVPATGRRVAVLGEMRELGAYSESGHRQVGRALAESPIDAALLVGPEARHIEAEALRSGYPETRIRFAGALEDVAMFLRGLRQGDVALVKGSRALGLERAVEEARR